MTALTSAVEMKSTLFPLVLLATLGIGAAPQMQSIPLVRKRAGMPLSKRAGFEHVEALERGIRRVYGKYGMTAPPLEGLGTSEEALRKRAGFVQLADVTGDIVRPRFDIPLRCQNDASFE